LDKFNLSKNKLNYTPPENLMSLEQLTVVDASSSANSLFTSLTDMRAHSYSIP